MNHIYTNSLFKSASISKIGYVKIFIFSQELALEIAVYAEPNSNKLPKSIITPSLKVYPYEILTVIISPY